MYLYDNVPINISPHYKAESQCQGPPDKSSEYWTQRVMALSVGSSTYFWRDDSVDLNGVVGRECAAVEKAQRFKGWGRWPGILHVF